MADELTASLEEIRGDITEAVNVLERVGTGHRCIAATVSVGSPRLLAAVEAVLKLADEARDWGKNNPEVLFFEKDIREAIAAALTGAQPDEAQLAEEDLRVEVFRNGAVSPAMIHNAVRVTHLPTGVTVTAEGGSSVLQLKAEALRELRAKVREAIGRELTGKGGSDGE